MNSKQKNMEKDIDAFIEFMEEYFDSWLDDINKGEMSHPYYLARVKLWKRIAQLLLSMKNK